MGIEPGTLIAEPIWFDMLRAWSPWYGLPAVKLAQARERSPTCPLVEIAGDWRKARLAFVTLILSPHLFAASELARGS